MKSGKSFDQRRMATRSRAADKRPVRRKSPGPETLPRVARRERRRAQSREEIIEAVARVILRDGIGKLTLEAVAADIGLTKAALYYYYPSKDALLFEMIY